MFKHFSLDGLNFKKGLSFLTVNNSIIQENDFWAVKMPKLSLTDAMQFVEFQYSVLCKISPYFVVIEIMPIFCSVLGRFHYF